jgi:ppGpp synthetase/RelA/SpoT-type nucleotidyltranferase
MKMRENQMNWSKLDYSKTQVRKAGETLAKSQSDTDTDDLKTAIDSYKAAYEILANWRATHAYPMQIILSQLRKKAFEIDGSAIVAQRLKRYPSILAKLQREPHMKLDRMEDIAGCRVVLDNIRDVYKLRDALTKSRSKNKLKRARDYIEKPKSSGYRGIHLIYTYEGEKGDYKGLPVELQLRSKVQHSWATAVEVVGTFLQEALKSSRGNQDWLDFFECTGEAFYALEENAPFARVNELSKIVERLQVFERLSAFAVATNVLSETQADKADFYLISLDITRRRLNFKGFTKRDLDKGFDLYAQYESEFKNDPSKDVVLISAESVEGLKKAYPNYFADTSDFVRNLKTVLKAPNAI